MKKLSFVFLLIALCFQTISASTTGEQRHCRAIYNAPLREGKSETNKIDNMFELLLNSSHSQKNEGHSATAKI